MKCKKLMFVLGLTFCIAMNVSGAHAFGLGDLTKSKSSASDVDWGAIGTQSTAALVNLYTGQATLSEAVADLAEVVGLNEEAATARGQIEKLKECGSSSCGEFSEVQESDETLTQATLEKLEGMESLTEEQKQKSSDAMKKYLAGGLMYAKGLTDAKALSEKAMDAPALQKAKFAGLIKAVPVAAGGAKSILQTAPKLYTLATTKEIEYPEEQQDEMMSALTM